MNILVRTEIGGIYGLGHGTRCRALAKALDARGAQVEFVTETPALVPFVAPFVCHQVTAWHLHPDICIIDTKSTAAMTPMHGAQVVRIDNPHADAVETALCIAPVAHWAPTTVTRLHAAFGDRFLYGWDYVMLDAEVTSQPPIPYTARQEGSIVFCAGGSDPTGALDKMYAWMEETLVDVRKVFCLGQQAGGKIAARMLWQCTQQRHDGAGTFVERFSRKYLREAALVVSMFGVTPYECLYWQTPTLCVAHTQENADDARRLDIGTASAIESWGHIDDMTADAFRSKVAGSWHNLGERWRMHEASAGLMDGRGVERVADAILRLA